MENLVADLEVPAVSLIGHAGVLPARGLLPEGLRLLVEFLLRGLFLFLLVALALGLAVPGTACRAKKQGDGGKDGDGS